MYMCGNQESMYVSNVVWIYSILSDYEGLRLGNHNNALASTKTCLACALAHARRATRKNERKSCRKCRNLQNIWFFNSNCHTHEWVTSHIWMRQASHQSASCHKHERVTSHIWTTESRHTYQQLSHLKYTNDRVTSLIGCFTGQVFWTRFTRI